MPITPVAFVDGNPLLEAEVSTELARVRSYINGNVAASDVQAASLRAPHVYRPESFGFPKGACESVVQTLAGRKTLMEPVVGQVFITTRGLGSAAPQRFRQSIFFDMLDENDTARLLGMRVHIQSTSGVRITANWAATAIHNDTTSGLSYPDQAGGFRLARQQVNGAKAVYAGSFRRLHIDKNEGMHTLASETLTAGVYDFWIEYDRNGASSNVRQVMIHSCCNLMLEVQRS